MHIQVICPGKDYWPLPWYLRRFEKDVVGWWDQVDVNTPSAPLIIASPEVEAALTNKLYKLTPLEDRQMYLFLFDKPYYMWLRPKIVELLLPAAGTGTDRKHEMTEPLRETCFVNSNCSTIAGMKRFSHEAMATTFEVIIVHEDERYASQAAVAAFDEVDRLERELSRFIENSDVARINSAGANQPLQLGLDTFECLKIAARIYGQTNGAFDITIGTLLKCWRNDDGTPRKPSPKEIDLARLHTGTNLLELHEAEHTVKLSANPVHVDLGGIGKGYAVDRVAELLRDWSIDVALISGGYSSVLALDAPPL